MQESLPWHFKVTQFETYDGTADPIDHLETFETAMLFQRVMVAELVREPLRWQTKGR